MKSRYALSTGNNTLDSYLIWRWKTRHIRKYGGPLLAITVAIIAGTLIWQMSHPRFEPVAENILTAESR